MINAQKPGPIPPASWLLVTFAGLVLAFTGVSALRSAATGADWSFAVLVVVVAATTARRLWLGTRWAWWLALAIALAGLFFVLPVTGAILLGGSTEPVGTGWDIALFPLTAAVLCALLATLWPLRGLSR
ncbi:MAG: hypothetical protein ABL963_00840 [Longimicrobiales bacterium]